ncbi:MAG: purine-nucleoside phosphorylase [Oscillospiraceae bacterium]|nr:purine-nucleoside phosphorylase [Oscillospiraceae bacterium]
MILQDRITAAAEYLLEKVALRPEIALVLGSGLGDYADTLDESVKIPYRDIPNFPQPTVEGHTGAFVFGKKQGKPVVVAQGRVHYYEGLPMQEITLPIRVLAAMGVKTLVLTNAAGGVNLSYKPGTLMLIADHINFSGANPLIGPNLEKFGPRFPDVSDLYTAALRERIKTRAAAADIPLAEGVYLMCSGPNYETPAEIRAFRALGADAVGMSTVPEALVAGHSGMQVVGVSCITNMAAGVLPVKLNHAEVVETAAKVHDQFHDLVDVILQSL